MIPLSLMENLMYKEHFSSWVISDTERASEKKTIDLVFNRLLGRGAVLGNPNRKWVLKRTLHFHAKYFVFLKLAAKLERSQNIYLPFVSSFTRESWFLLQLAYYVLLCILLIITLLGYEKVGLLAKHLQSSLPPFA